MFEHCIYFNTSALARRLEREWAVAFKPFELTPPQAFVLRVVLSHPGLLQKDVAETMGISRPTATRALDGLEALDLITRKASGGDGRETALIPTAKARKMHVAIDHASGVMTKRIKGLIGEQAFTDTVTSIRSVRSALQ